ncbi:MAG TPA: hypothetical protein VHE33_19710 [Acidobacteriaceae bacterium]|nr:hypothetical protein [Acidobacteriaceae bacterium]
MRRTLTAPLVLLTIAALLGAPGCEDPPTQIRNCVDDNRHIVPDDVCDNQPFTGSEILPGSYHYLYDGASGGHTGDVVVGGSWQPKFGARIVSGDTGATIHTVNELPHGGEGLGGD